MNRTIALAGNPNCGKTTLFNNLTGANQYVGNWPGVTVEKKEGKLKSNKEVSIIDLPGIYSLSPYTPEEVISRNYIEQERPSVIVNLVDASNLERNLYLTTQILEFNIPVVVALNMMDIVEKNGDKIDAKKLSEQLGCPVVELSALKGKGQEALIETALKAAGEPLSRRPVLDEIKRRSDASEDKSDREENMVNARYDSISEILKKSYKKTRSGMTMSDKIDRIVTNRILALPIFALVMGLVYYISIGTVGDWLTGWTNDVLFGEMIGENLPVLLEGLNVAPWLIGLICDGIVGGVGAVLGFVPQMLVLFFLLAILEDIGYMARIAFIMDRIFRRFGLSGKSFIPMLIASGCGVPGIMASRTIENENDRRMTIMTTGFIPCGAKMPIIGLFAGALFDGSAWVATCAYFIGVAAVIISGVILKKFKAFAGKPAPFVMELPNYHVPGARNILSATWERGWSFIKRAGTVILVASIAIWFLAGFGFTDDGFGTVEDMNDSVLADVGNVMVPVFEPIGFGGDEEAWKASVATVLGLVAKEEVVGTMGILYSDFDGGLDALDVDEDALDELEGDEYEEAEELLAGRAQMFAALASIFTPLSAFAFMLFNLLCAPCFAAIGAIKREMNNGKWTVAAVGYMCIFAYVVSLIFYQLGGLITGEVGFGVWTIIAAVCLVGMLYLMFRKNRYSEKAQEKAAVAA